MPQRDYKRKNKYYDEWVHTAQLPLKSGDRKSVLEWIYKSNIVPWYSTYILEKYYESDLMQDLIGELYLIISEIDEQKWQDLFKQGKFAISGYVTGIIKQQLYSKTSRIYHKYYKYAQKEIIMDDDYWATFYDEN